MDFFNYYIAWDILSYNQNRFQGTLSSEINDRALKQYKLYEGYE